MLTATICSAAVATFVVGMLAAVRSRPVEVARDHDTPADRTTPGLADQLNRFADELARQRAERLEHARRQEFFTGRFPGH